MEVPKSVGTRCSKYAWRQYTISYTFMHFILNFNVYACFIHVYTVQSLKCVELCILSHLSPPLPLLPLSPSFSLFPPHFQS